MKDTTRYLSDNATETAAELSRQLAAARAEVERFERAIASWKREEKDWLSAEKSYQAEIERLRAEVERLYGVIDSALEWFAGFPHCDGDDICVFTLDTADDVYHELVEVKAAAIRSAGGDE